MRPEATTSNTLALGVLLAGGQGERLGLGMPKAHAMLAGHTLFERALAALGGACARVWVAAPTDMSLPVVAGDRHPFSRVDDPSGAGGPLAGIAAAAAAAAFASAASAAGVRIVTLAVDLPLVTVSTLRGLLASYDALGAAPGSISALVPAPGGRMQPLAAVWSAPAFAALAGAFSRGERSLTRASATLAVRTLDDATLHRMGIAGDVALDVDTAADLAAIARTLHDAARVSA